MNDWTLNVHASQSYAGSMCQVILVAMLFYIITHTPMPLIHNLPTPVNVHVVHVYQAIIKRRVRVVCTGSLLPLITPPNCLGTKLCLPTLLRLPLLGIIWMCGASFTRSSLCLLLQSTICAPFYSGLSCVQACSAWPTSPGVHACRHPRVLLVLTPTIEWSSQCTM